MANVLLTTRCNLRCAYCFAQERLQENARDVGARLKAGLLGEPRSCHREARRAAVLRTEGDEAISTPRVRDCFASLAMTSCKQNPHPKQHTISQRRLPCPSEGGVERTAFLGEDCSRGFDCK